MECYILSNSVDDRGRSIRGQKQRINHILNERNLFELNEQNFCDQVSAIRKNEWVSAVQMEVIKKRVLVTGNDESATEELNTNDVNGLMQKVNDGSTVDKLEIDRTNIEIDQTVEEQKTRNVRLWKSMEL